MFVDQVLLRKREGLALTEDEIRELVEGFVDGSVTRAQAAAFLAFVYLKGMSPEETVALTLAMANSGERMVWSGIQGPFVDKHSTGGVGDKVSLVLAPLWAELGARVPMVSGRGLGHTGGTLDKIEAIPGFRTDLEGPALRRALETVGCFMNGQTAEVAPADRLLYALRNETSTVESIELITASILSKKLSEGIDELVLDVKWGTGAFMKTRQQAQALADSLVRVGTGAGLVTRARITDMNQPLGHAVGNALEVEEAVRCLKGEGPEDLAALVCDLIGDPRARQVLDSGAAYARWERLLLAHGGDPDAPLLGGGCAREDLLAPRAGIVQACDAYDVARAAFVLGAGRTRADAPVHAGVGIIVHKKQGEQADKGEPLATLVHDGRGLPQARAFLNQAFKL